MFESNHEAEAFARGLATRAIGRTIVFHDCVSSTNDLALDAARSGGAHGMVFVADAQDAGRGRRGRRWEAPPGAALLFSVLIRPAGIPPQAGGWIPLVAGLACAEAIAHVAPEAGCMTLKWPNDIVLPSEAAPGWKKLGGILCESALPALGGNASGDAGYVVIGIGLNVNQNAAMLPDTDKAPPSSLLIEGGRTIERRALLKKILERLEVNLDRLSDPASRSELCASIEDKMRAWLPPSKTLVFHAPAQADTPARSGIFAGLDEFGCLIIFEQNERRAFADAEIVRVECVD